ncbi:MAG: leucine-rich repeat domain-containing protein [Candidatus Coproplasma sp.]
MASYSSGTAPWYDKRGEITSAVISDGVTSIGAYAFYECSYLISAIIGKSIISISNKAFFGCYKLIEIKNLSSLNITAGSNNYGYVAYYAKRVYNEGESYLSTDANGYIFFNDDTDKIIVSYSGTETDLTIPDSVTYIYRYAFYGCSGLTSVKVPDSVKSIGNSAFNKCSGLTSVTIGNGVTSIGYAAFYDCGSLTSITIPDSVINIGDYVFYNCVGLTSVTIGNTESNRRG